jgi:ubiquinol-cytochrome c reductase cytochrome b subunit
MSTPAHIVPEWYLSPFYAILRAIPDKLLGVLAMFGAIGILFILPWLDRSPVRSAHYRPMYKIFYVVFIINMLALGYLGVQNPEGIYIILGRTCTAWYFIHFLIILPLLNVIETPKALPKSISDPIFSSGSSEMLPAAPRGKK